MLAVPVAGGAPVVLSEPLDRSCGALGEAPVWSPDGSRVLFGAEDEGRLSVYAAAGGAVTRVVGGERVIAGFSASADGRLLAFAGSEPTAPAEIFVCGADGSLGERRLTDLNRAWLGEVALARPERVRFERDGFAVDAWVMRPPGANAGRRRCPGS